ncbi:hypothetical protein BO94DRAFT_568215 [Aspergillus sclerotioniger CBS 115572]|uniref:Histone-lysine N-methyltransferase SET5 n=1 Tax=Aspergillus sclerotioniger CBS 115572 TaxID=1450535 RepID=A0A317VSC3_9EURO|nr:hypothetical protein BO94DRAFT_568215 [Aspergillus sclerotioniger CBS 115572]PWY77223.1 hypothetical protein BO94DRAFT_568215 [Aspergillus sclerotioniger CBS 115572]
MEQNPYDSTPGHETVTPPLFPPRPDLYDEVGWTPHLSRDDAKIARRFWSLPDSLLGRGLGEQSPSLRRTSGEELQAHPLHALARNVYNHMVRDHLKPLAPGDWVQRWAASGLQNQTWSFNDIFGGQGFDLGAITEDPNRVAGQLISAMKVQQLRDALEKRNISNVGTAAQLRQRLRDDKRKIYRKYRVLPRSDLSHWGIQRGDTGKYAIEITDENEIGPLDMYTCAILVSPYNPTYWLSRAYCHYQHAFFDLAVGDAYRAQLLCEVLVDPSCRNRQPGLYTRTWQAVEQHIRARDRDPATGKLYAEVDLLRNLNGINYFGHTLRKAIRHVISLSLAALQCWDDYSIKEKELGKKLHMERDEILSENRYDVMEPIIKLLTPAKSKTAPEYFFYEKRAGNVFGERGYPHDADDKDRSADEFVEKATEIFINQNGSLPWNKCKVHVDNRRNNGAQLSIVATEDIKAKEIIFVEVPPIRGHLNLRKLSKGQIVQPRLRCDNCQRGLPAGHQETYSNGVQQGNLRETCRCISKQMPIAFCPAPNQEDEACAENARARYHFRACGKDWEWLHNAMRPITDELRGTEPKGLYYTHTNEAHTTLLSLLLREVFDITLHRRERDPHLMAHEIDELLVLESPQNWQNQSFPFTLAGNVQVPFDILMQLGVDIFRDLAFDTWVIQLILKKLTAHIVPWDPELRKPTEIINEKKIPKGTIQVTLSGEDEDLAILDPTFHALYLYPGFSLFNHACPKIHNAMWGYDPEVPNRLLVWSTKPIQKGEEIRIPYIHPNDPKATKITLERVLGRPCDCGGPHIHERRPKAAAI